MSESVNSSSRSDDQEDNHCLNLDENFSSPLLLKKSLEKISNNFPQTLILDIGSREAKIGLSNSKYYYDSQVYSFISAFADIRSYRQRYGSFLNFNDEYLVGNRAFSNSIVKSTFPFQANGKTSNWLGVEKIYDHCFEYFDLNESLPLLLSENNVNSSSNDDGKEIITEERGKKAQYLFEKGYASKIAFVNQVILTLVSYGLYNGTVFHSANAQTIAMCINNCKIWTKSNDFQHSNNSFESNEMIGGDYLTEWMINDFRTNKDVLLGHHYRNVCTSIKETLCQVKLPSKIVSDEKFELPSGEMLTVKGEWLEEYPERLFIECKPEIAITRAISSLPEQYRGYYYKNIVLGGGNCQFPGLRERLLLELESVTPKEYQSCLNIHKFQGYQLLEFKGANILSQLSTFQHDAMISRSEFEEFGSSIFNREISSLIF